MQHGDKIKRFVKAASAILAPLGLFPLIQVCTSFGTLNRFGAHSEHERITRAALHCSGTSSDGTCFEPDSLDKLAGKTGTWGAVGAPDWNDLCTPEAHFDDADFSDTPGYPQSREQATEALERTIAYFHGRLGEALTAASGMLDHDSQTNNRNGNWVTSSL